MQWVTEPPIPTSGLYSWHHWDSRPNSRMITLNEHASYEDITYLYKTKPKIVFWGLLKSSISNYYYPIFLSPDRDAVEFGIQYWNTSTSTYEVRNVQTSWFSLTDRRGIGLDSTTWYGSGLLTTIGPIASDTRITPGPYTVEKYLLQDDIWNPNAYEDEEDLLKHVLELAQNMIDRIYSVHFHEKYQINQSYDFYSSGNNKYSYDIVMKGVGVWLLSNLHLYENDVLDPSSAYTQFSNDCLSVSNFRYLLTDRLGINTYFQLYANRVSDDGRFYGLYIWRGSSNEVIPSPMNVKNYSTHGGSVIFDVKGYFNYGLYADYSSTLVNYSGRSLEYYHDHWGPGSIQFGEYEHFMGVRPSSTYSLSNCPFLTHLTIETLGIDLTEENE